ncbi:MAG: spermidine synthase [Gammaproteobacteria bacterium]
MISFLRSDKSQLIQLSFLMLFVELALIRWSQANVMFFVNVSNFILLSSFLGIGIGFLRSKSSFRLFQLSPFFLAMIIIGCYLCRYSYEVKLDASSDDIIFMERFFTHHLYPEWCSLPFIFIAVTLLMASIADEVARVFQRFPPLQGYRYEMLGSLCGVSAFLALSFLYPAPLSWGIMISLLFISLLFNSERINFKFLFLLQMLALIVLNATFLKESFAPDQYWSSYYKIETKPFSKNRHVVNVNGFPQQVIETAAQRETVKPFYALPYLYRTTSTPLNDVLVVGAGTGGDVAIALAKGAIHVDAVEIDPVLYQLGKKLNPDLPYSDPRVSIFINDGRAFLQQSHKKYDMIIFALTDSLMLITGQSFLRLENYLYTIEAMTTIKKHLKPNGIFTIYNYYGVGWLSQRLANTVNTVFASAPCFTTYTRVRNSTSSFLPATVIAISPNSSALSCPSHWEPNKLEMVAPITDDKPFLYLSNNALSLGYVFILLGVVLVIAISALKLTQITLNSIAKHVDLFLMGAAFLLLETKNIINFSLLFGTTWFVNALVFVSILLTMTLAIEVTHRFKKIHSAILYIGLILSLFAAWLIPSSYFLDLPIFARFLLATAVAFAPIFFANLIFSARFQNVLHSSQAFGANLLGAVAGGILEYASLFIGYHNLLILIMMLYFFAIFTLRSSRVSEATI